MRAQFTETGITKHLIVRRLNALVTRKAVKGKNILVTGGTGSIGEALVKRLFEYDAGRVLILARDGVKLYLLRTIIHDERLETIVCDVRDVNAMQRIFDKYKDIDIIYHVAAEKHVSICEENPVEATLTNVIGTQNVVDMALRYNISKSVLISTDKAVEPVNVMGASKLIAERIFLRAAKRVPSKVFHIVRFGNVSGSRGSVIPIFIRDLLSKKKLAVTDPGVTRFMMKISRATDLIIDSSNIAVGGEIFIAKMKAFMLRDLVKLMVNDIAPKFCISPNEVKVKVCGLETGEKLHEKLVSVSEARNLYDLGDIYVITDERMKKHIKYKKYDKANITDYTSEKAEFIPYEELKSLVLEFVKTLK